MLSRISSFQVVPARLLFLLKDHRSCFFTGMGTGFPTFFSFSRFLSFLPERGSWQPKLPFFLVSPICSTLSCDTLLRGQWNGVDPERVHSSVEGECASALRRSGARKLSAEPDPFLRDWHVKRMIDSFFFSAVVRGNFCPGAPVLAGFLQRASRVLLVDWHMAGSGVLWVMELFLTRKCRGVWEAAGASALPFSQES